MSKDNKVLATINGKEITENDIEMHIKQLPVGSREYYYSSSLGKKRLLEEKVCIELLYNYAKDNELEKNEQYLNQLERLKKELLAKVATDKVLDAVNIDENDLKEHYFLNKENYKTAQTVTARHILLDSKKKADEVKAKIDEGMSFEDAAKEYSLCSTAQDGGNLGTFPMGTMVPELEKAAFDLKIGEVSNPVKSYYGYHIVKVEKKGGGEVRPFEQVRNIIKEKVVKEKKDIKYDELIKELEKKYNLTYNNEI